MGEETYLGSERPLVERADDQGPVGEGQPAGRDVRVEALFGRQGGVGQRLEEAACTGGERARMGGWGECAVLQGGAGGGRREEVRT